MTPQGRTSSSPVIFPQGLKRNVVSCPIKPVPFMIIKIPLNTSFLPLRVLQAEGKLSFPRTLPQNNKHMMPLEFSFSLLPFRVFRISHLQTHEGICLGGKYVLHVDFSRRLSADVHMWAHFLPSEIIIFSLVVDIW